MITDETSEVLNFYHKSLKGRCLGNQFWGNQKTVLDRGSRLDRPRLSKPNLEPSPNPNFILKGSIGRIGWAKG